MRTKTEPVTTTHGSTFNGMPDNLNTGEPQDEPDNTRGHPIDALRMVALLDISLGNTIGKALGIVIGATLVTLTLAEVLPDFFTGIADINNELSNASLNSSAAENIAGVMPIIVGVLGVFLVVGLIANFMDDDQNDL